MLHSYSYTIGNEINANLKIGNCDDPSRCWYFSPVSSSIFQIVWGDEGFLWTGYGGPYLWDGIGERPQQVAEGLQQETETDHCSGCTQPAGWWLQGRWSVSGVIG